MDPILATAVSNFIISDLIFYHSQQPLTSPTFDRLTVPPYDRPQRKNKREVSSAIEKTPLFCF
jgi:hypothetical protein